MVLPTRETYYTATGKAIGEMLNQLQIRYLATLNFDDNLNEKALLLELIPDDLHF